MTVNVLVTDSVDQQCTEIFKSEGFRVEYKPALPPDEIKKTIGDFEVLIVRSGTQVTADIIAAGTKLKIIGRAGAGVDNIDVDAATRRGIIVMNTPGGNTISTAEHTVSMMLALARNIPQAHKSLSGGKWDRKSFVGTELYGKTLGIIGLGKVGKEVALRCKVFEMKILGYDPVLSTEAALQLGVELVELEELIKRSDFITVHTPYSNETKGLLGEKQLSMCKKDVRIINCARGGIVDEAALLRALNSGHVAGAALDVFEKEPPGDNPLLQHPHVVATPHLAASTEEAQEKVAIQIARQVVDALHSRGIVGGVNADAITSAQRTELQPFLQLAEKMGKLVIQLLQGKLRTVTFQTSGQLLNESSNALCAALLKGMFGKILDEPVNYINAPLIARERGISVNIVREEDHELYTHVVSVRYETDKERRSLAGTVFGNKDIRIVEIDGFHFEIKPEGYLLLYSNVDRPGILARMGTVLAKSDINIGGLALGRYGVGTEALTVVNLDSIVPNRILAEISSLDGIFGVKLVFID